MFKSCETEYSLYSPKSEGESERFIGKIRAVISHRSSEEAASEGLIRANESSLAAVDLRYEPDGGFVRGMTIRGDGGEEYVIRLPIRHRKLCVLLLSRYLFDGDGGRRI